jgi:hypothetical protein
LLAWQGAICVDTLGTGWSPVQTIKTALLSLRMLLEFPNPKDPQDAEVAKMMIEQPEQFALKAQEWAVKYAGAKPSKLDTSKYKKTQAPAKAVDSSRYVELGSGPEETLNLSVHQTRLAGSAAGQDGVCYVRDQG